MKPHAYHGIYPTLLCNLSCESCCREDSDVAQGLQLTYQQILQSMKETQFFCDDYQIHKVFTGGEPTLWRDGEKCITDIMVDAAIHRFYPHLITNGQAFQSVDATRYFMDAYLSCTTIPIDITVSADLWHGNVDDNGRCVALDNLLNYREQQGLSHEQLAIGTEWTCSTHKEHLPTKHFMANYEGLVDTMILLPIAPCGRGKNLDDIAPKLCPASNNKETLGAFADILEQRAYSKGLIDNIDSFQWLANEVIVNECAVGNGNLSLYADGNYYTCSDGIGDTLFCICSVGEMSSGTISEYFKMNPTFRLYNELGPIGFLREYTDNQEEINDIIGQLFPFGISGRGGCAIHRKVIERGLFNLEEKV